MTREDAREDISRKVRVILLTEKIRRNVSTEQICAATGFGVWRVHRELSNPSSLYAIALLSYAITGDRLEMTLKPREEAP